VRKRKRPQDTKPRCRLGNGQCDGTRPKCGPCVHKGRSCGYEGEVGQSRQAAMKARLKVLERLFDTLQNQTPEDAERLLQRIRSADGLPSVISQSEDDSADAAPLPSGPSHQPSTSPASSSASGRPSSSLYQLRSDSSTGDFISRPLPFSGSLAGLSSTPSASSHGSRAVSNASTLLARLVLPSQALTTQAVDSFFASTGQLFHVFSRA
jgi:hypothetical protein